MSSLRNCSSESESRRERPGARRISRKWPAILVATAVYAVGLGCSAYLDNPALASSKGTEEGDGESGSDVVALTPGASLSCDEGGLRFELEICNTGMDDLEQVVVKHELPLGFGLLEGSIAAVDAAGDPIDVRQCDGREDGDGDGHHADDGDDDDGDHDGLSADDGEDDGAATVADDHGDDDGGAADDDSGDDDAEDDGQGESDGVELCLGSPIPPGECVLVTFVATIGEVWSEVEVHAKTDGGESDGEDVEVKTGSDIGGTLNDLLATACEPCEAQPATGDLAAFCGLAPNECDPLVLFGCADAVDTAVADLLDRKCASCCPDDLTCSCIFGE